MPRFLAQIDASRIPLKGLVPESGSTAPASPVEGQLWTDSVNHKTMAYLNSVWVDLTLGGGGSYTTGTAAQIATGTDTSLQVWQASVLKTAIVANSPVASVAGRTGAVTLAKGDVGLGNVDNTADTAKPVSTAQQTALNLKADLASPALTGSPTAPTQTSTDNSTKIATTAYVTSAVQVAQQGLNAKQSVRVATTANLTGTNFTALDGVTLAANDRILVKNQTSAAGNGIFLYDFTNSNLGARALDMDAWSEVPSAFVFVEEGTVNHDTGWISTADRGGTINTTAMPWAQFFGAGSITAGAGLNLTGGVMSIPTSGVVSSMIQDGTVTGNDIANGTLVTAHYSNGSVTAAILGAASVVLTAAAGTVSGILPVANGGSGSNSFRTALYGQNVAEVVNGGTGVANPALTAGTWTTYTSLWIGTDHPSQVLFWDATTFERVELDWRFNNTTHVIEVKADIAVSASALLALATGIIS